MAKTDVLLILAPCWAIDVPPLGIAYLSSYLKSKGYTVCIFDMNIDLYHRLSDAEKKWWSMDRLKYWATESLFHRILNFSGAYLEDYVDKILSHTPRLIGFSIYDSNRLFAIEIAKKIKQKKPDTIVVFGGPSCFSNKGRSWVHPDILDIIIAGEGEDSLANIITQFNSISKLDLPLIISSTPILNINSLPFPTFEGFNLKQYQAQDELPILMTRGCIGRCTFCNDYNLFKPFRYRSAQNVVEEIKERINKYGIQHFKFHDLAINSNVELVDSLCKLIIRQSININWVGQGIPYGKMTQELLKNMHKAGCRELTYGLESGSNRILKKMGKFFTKEVAAEVIRTTSECGIKVCINIIVGFPGETEADFMQTINFIKDNQKYIDMISSLNTCCVNSNTELDAHAEEYNIVLPADANIRALYWNEKNGSDYLMRCKRARDSLFLLKDLNIPLFQNNLYDAIALKMYSLEDSDILIVSVPPFDTKMPPLGIAYLATFLKNKGINTTIYDFNLELYNNAVDKSHWQINALNYSTRFEIAEKMVSIFRYEIEDFVDAILGTATKIIGFSVNAISIFVANEIARRIKLRDPKRMIIFGGPGCFWKFQRDAIYPCYADIFVMGEGEEVLFKIIQRLKGGMKFRMSPMVFAPIPIMNLDSIPFPTFSEFNLLAYNFNSNYKPLPLLASRGCVRRCSYCIDIRLWPGYRFRTPAHILEEIKYHINNNATKAFEFNDLLCNGNLRQLSLLCDLIIEERLEFNWVSYGTVRSDMGEELFSKLKQSGCHTLIYGLESGSNNVLRRMNKQYTVDEAEVILRLTHQAGISTNINLIVGFPGESDEDFLETIRFLERNHDYIDEITNISTYVLFPFSEVALNKESYGISWDETKDPLTFKDSEGLDIESRNKRLEMLVELVDKMGLKRAIVNQPTEEVQSVSSK